MADLYLTEHGSSIKLNGDNLEIFYENKKLAIISIHHLESIQIFGNVQISTQAIIKIMKAGIELAFHTEDGKLLGQITPPLPKNLNLRIWQHQLKNDYQFRLEFTRTLLKLKFLGGLRLLEQFGKNNDEIHLSENIAELRKWIEKIEKAGELQEVLGLEGSFAMNYYKSYSKLFKNPKVFQGRSKRPPMDPGNAVLSYSYTILTNRIGSLLDGLGYDPFIGFFHTLDYGRMSLACDLVEAVRPIFCDWITLKWFNLGILDPEKDFEPNHGGIYLNKEGQKKFFPQYRKEYDQERIFLGQKLSIKEILQILHKWLRDSLKEKKVQSIETYAKTHPQFVDYENPDRKLRKQENDGG